jgi:hypothetical protein
MTTVIELHQHNGSMVRSSVSVTPILNTVLQPKKTTAEQPQSDSISIALISKNDSKAHIDFSDCVQSVAYRT